MSLMNVVRIAKLLALLAFVLPWAAVSCNNVDVATASGIEMIQGKMSANPNAEAQMKQQMASQFGGLGGGLDGGSDGLSGGLGGGLGGGGMDSRMQSMPELGMNYFGIAAAIVIVAGLLLSFAGKGKTAARNVAVTSLLGLALVFGTVWLWKDQMKTEIGKDGGGQASSPFGDTGGLGGGGMAAMGGNMLDQMLQERFGYWIALSALAVAAGAGAIGMAGGAGAVKPNAEPPAA